MQNGFGNRGIVPEPATAPTPKREKVIQARILESGMIEVFKSFFADESGAVTVDWVVLTAAVVGMAMLTYVGLADNTQTVTDATGAAVLTAQEFLTN